jgi:hypothetical protein
MQFNFEERIVSGRIYINAGVKGGYVPRYRWIWEYYNGIPPRGFVIHHVDENKMNDEISNLKMMSEADHKSYHSSRMKRSEEWKKMISERNTGSKNGMAKAIGGLNPAAVKVINLETGEIFDTVRSAGLKHGCHPANISTVCMGRRKRAGGYHWKHYEAPA